MKLIIERIDNKWTVNGKFFAELSKDERELLAKFIKSYDN